jgi:hypothetical protein
MKILVACEYSGAVRDAFIKRGHFAMSCDLLPTDVPGPHHQGDVFEIIDRDWDLMIAHPPCTYLCSSRWANQTDSGQNRLGPSDDRWKERSKTYQGIADAMASQWG